MTSIETRSLVPRFRWGSIAPRERKVIVGPGYEFYRLLPLEIIEVRTELGIADYTADAVNNAIARFWECVGVLTREKVDHIVLSGAPISVQLGHHETRELLDAAQDKTGITFDAPLEAVIASMHHLGMTRLAIASRWSAELNALLAQYFSDAGIEVVASTERGQWAKESAAMTFEDGLKLALEVGREAAMVGEHAEAVYVVGGAAMSLHVIPAVEEEFGKPVFTNFSAAVFNRLVRPGVIDPIVGWGRLLAGS